MFYVNDKGNLQVGEHPGEGWIQVNDPKSSYYKLKPNWKECIPDVWEFNPFKVSTQLNFLVDTVVGDKLAKAINYRYYGVITGTARIYLPKGYYFESYYDNTVFHCPGVPTPDVYGMGYLGYSNGTDFFVGMMPG